MHWSFWEKAYLFGAIIAFLSLATSILYASIVTAPRHH